MHPVAVVVVGLVTMVRKILDIAAAAEVVVVAGVK
jgi:hypothetical protein